MPEELRDVKYILHPSGLRDLGFFKGISYLKSHYKSIERFKNLSNKKMNMLKKILLIGMVLFPLLVADKNEAKNMDKKNLEKICLINKDFAEGFKVGTIKYREGEINYLIINPQKYDLKIISGKEGIRSSKAKKDYPLAFVNGSFFKENFEPIGLVISNEQIENPKLNSEKWGIFSIDKNNYASIKYSTDFNSEEEQKFAIQGYPMLIYNKKIKLKNPVKKAQRTAIGINERGEIIILTTRQKAFTLKEIGELMLKPQEEGGYECISALNLDGGSSSQMYVNNKIRKYSLNKVSNYILVFPK